MLLLFFPLLPFLLHLLLLFLFLFLPLPPSPPPPPLTSLLPPPPLASPPLLPPPLPPISSSSSSYSCFSPFSPFIPLDPPLIATSSFTTRNLPPCKQPHQLTSLHPTPHTVPPHTSTAAAKQMTTTTRLTSAPVPSSRTVPLLPRQLGHTPLLHPLSSSVSLLPDEEQQ